MQQPYSLRRQQIQNRPPKTEDSFFAWLQGASKPIVAVTTVVVFFVIVLISMAASEPASPHPPPSPSPPPHPPSSPPRVPSYNVWMLPNDKCEYKNADETYVYSSRAEALSACEAAGCTGLADWNLVNDVSFVYNKKTGPDFQRRGSRCAAQWWASYVTPASSGMAWWMSETASECGSKGWNAHTGKAAAACIGCSSEINFCSPPPSPPSPPVQPFVSKPNGDCITHLTEQECKTKAAHIGYTLSVASSTTVPPGCTSIPIVSGAYYYNTNMESTASCVGDVTRHCLCGMDPPSPPPLPPKPPPLPPHPPASPPAPIQPLYRQVSRQCDTDLTEIECRTWANNEGRTSFVSVNIDWIPKGCTFSQSNTYAYYNAHPNPITDCALSVHVCMCGVPVVTPK